MWFFDLFKNREINRKNVVGYRAKGLADIKNNKNNMVSSRIEAASTLLETNEIKDFVDAINQARMVDGSKSMLLSAYDSIMLDTHLKSIVETRILTVLQSKFKLTNKDNEDKSNLLNKKWFFEFIRYSLESIFYGTTIIEFTEFGANEVKKVSLIPRENVKAEQKRITKTIDSKEGWNYNSQLLAPFYVEVQGDSSLGLLHVAGIMAIFKKFAMSSWIDFSERYGIPLRIAKTNSHDSKRVETLAQMLDKMGGAGWLVADSEENIEIVGEGTGGNFDVFESLKKTANSEMSKLILGQDGTTDNKDATGTYGSLAVLENIAITRHNADRFFIKTLVNEELIPRLISFGYKIEGYTFDWDESKELSVTEFVDVVTKLSSVFDVDAEQVEKKTGIKVKNKTKNHLSEGNTFAAARYFPQLEVKEPTLRSNSGVSRSVLKKEPKTTRYEDFKLCSCVDVEAKINTPKFDNDNLLKQVWDNKDSVFDKKYFKTTYNYLKKGLSKGFYEHKKLTDSTPSSSTQNPKAAVNLDVDYEDMDWEREQMMQLNLAQFSAAKTIDVVRKVNKLAREHKDYRQFKEEAKKHLEGYNVRFLWVEYMMAWTCGQHAANYNRLKANNYTTWRYVTAGDSLVRPAHKKLDKKLFEADGDATDIIYVPNGWGCRCYFEGVLRTPKKHTTKQEVISMLKDTPSGKKGLTEWDNMVKGGFNINRAKAMSVFSENQMYSDNFYDKLNVQVNGLKSYKDIEKKGLPNFQKVTKSTEGVENWYKKEVVKKSGFLIDRDERKIGLSRKVLSNNSTDILELIPEVLRRPDEIYMQKDVVKTKKNILNYVKFFDKKAISVEVEQKQKKLNILRWEVMDDEIDKKRWGILLN